VQTSDRQRENEFLNVFKTLAPHQQRSLAMLFASGLLFWSSMASMLPTIPLYVKDVGGSAQDVGLVMGAFAIGLLASRRQLGLLADRRSRKLVLFMGTVVCAIAPLGYLVVRSIPLLIALRAFHGISIAAFTTAYSALVADLAPPNRRGELIGYMSLVTPIGVAIGPAIGGLLQTQFGYVPLFLLAAGLGGLSGLGTLAIVEPRSTRLHPASVPAAESSDRSGISWHESAIGGLIVGAIWYAFSHSIGVSAFTILLGAVVCHFLRQVFATPTSIMIPSLVMLLTGTIFGILATFMPLFVKETGIAFNPGWFYTAAAISSFGVRLIAGPASDRLGRGLFVSLALIGYGTAMSILRTAHTPTAFLMAGFVEGMAAGTLFPITIALMSDRSQPEERGRIFAVCIGGFDMGIAIAGPILGALAPQLGYRNLFAFAAILAGLALVLFASFNSKNLSHSLRFALGRGRDLYAIGSEK
jgi:MFS family permease